MATQGSPGCSSSKPALVHESSPNSLWGKGESLQTSLMTWGRGQLPAAHSHEKKALLSRVPRSQHQSKQDHPLLRSCVSSGQGTQEASVCLPVLSTLPSTWKGLPPHEAPPEPDTRRGRARWGQRGLSVFTALVTPSGDPSPIHMGKLMSIKAKTQAVLQLGSGDARTPKLCSPSHAPWPPRVDTLGHLCPPMSPLMSGSNNRPAGEAMDRKPTSHKTWRRIPYCWLFLGVGEDEPS